MCISLSFFALQRRWPKSSSSRHREEGQNLSKNEWTLQLFCFLAHQKKQTYVMSLHWKDQCIYNFSTPVIFHCLKSRKCTQLQTRTINLSTLSPTPLKLVTNWVRTSTGKTCGMSKEIKSRTQLKPVAWLNRKYVIKKFQCDNWQLRVAKAP